MAVSYYPGCSLHGLAVEYDQSLRAVCRTLGIELTELSDWNCCGASSAHFMDESLATELVDRNLAIAERGGQELLVPCSACFQQLRRGSSRGVDEAGEERVSIHHVNDFFATLDRIEAVQRAVVRPLTGLASVAYYGCLSQRPPAVTGAESPENPTTMDRILRAIGLELRPWSYKTECCGASLAMARPDLVQRMSGKLLEAAREAGAECLVTDCPLCQTNLDSRQAEIEAQLGQRFDLPVFYVTELMGLAFGDPDARRWWSRHLVDPRPLLARKELS